MAHEHHPATSAATGAGIGLTEKAAAKVLELMKAEGKDPAQVGLRVGVIGGGCSGFQYLLDFDSARDGDLKFDSHGARILVDSRSFDMVKGSVVDYVETLMGSGFQVKNPNVKGSCGCGSSFNV
jgi:iron-sulfur cluster assembly protein